MGRPNKHDQTEPRQRCNQTFGLNMRREAFRVSHRGHVSFVLYLPGRRHQAIKICS